MGKWLSNIFHLFDAINTMDENWFREYRLCVKNYRPIQEKNNAFFYIIQINFSVTLTTATERTMFKKKKKLTTETVCRKYKSIDKRQKMNE